MKKHLTVVAKGLVLFAFFYGAGWIGWFLLFTGADVARVYMLFVSGWTEGSWGLPMLIQVFAVGTALTAAWALHALDHLGLF